MPFDTWAEAVLKRAFQSLFLFIYFRIIKNKIKAEIRKTCMRTLLNTAQYNNSNSNSKSKNSNNIHANG